MAPGRAPRRQDGPPRAGQSLQTAYAQQRGVWLSERRKAAGLSALWWGPGIALVSLIAGASTHFFAFGVIFFALGIWAALDVLFRRPDELLRIKARAAAESDTGRALRSVEIRGRATVLHDRMVIGTAQPFEVEHFVLFPRGAFLIDTKQWTGHGIKILGDDLYVDQVDQGPMLKQLVEHARVLGEMLTSAAARDEEVGVVSVQPVLTVYTESLPGTPRTMYGVIIVTARQLPEILRNSHPRWSDSAVASLTEAAGYLLVRK